MKNNKGFSLVEIVVVIGIIAILSAIAIPNVIGWRDDEKLRNAVSNLRADLHEARFQALRENSLVAVVFESEGYFIFVDNGTNSGDWNCDSDEKILRNRKVPTGVRIVFPTNFDAPNDRTRFNGRGLPDQNTLSGPGLTGAITFENSKGDQKTLLINRLGSINT